MIPLAEVAAHFRNARYAVRPALEREMKHAMETAAKDAKSFIGDNKLGWAPLAESTLRSKAARGYPTPAPLLREGTLRDSISSKVEVAGALIKGEVGSTDPVSVFHEFGTSKMPPRPFIAPACMLAVEPLEKALGKLMVRALTPGATP